MITDAQARQLTEDLFVTRSDKVAIAPRIEAEIVDSRSLELIRRTSA